MLATEGRYVGPARMQGLLFDFGRYPGARPGKGQVLGDVFHLPDAPAILAELDEYEGAEFDRSVVSVTGAPDCWVYWYVGTAAGRLIPSGDWFER